MAEEKRSFLLYTDLIHTVKKMPKEKAGELFLHILEYVNDNNPETDDIIINLVFEPIKQQMKRDLVKWEDIKEKRSYNGIMGNLKRWNTDLYDLVLSGKMGTDEAVKIAEHRKTSLGDSKGSQTVANVADNVNVNVNVINKNTNSIVDRKLKFSQSLIPFLDKYGKETIREFCDYWTEPNKSKTKFKMELQKTWDLEKRLERWARNDFNSKKPVTQKGAIDQSNNSKLFA